VGDHSATLDVECLYRKEKNQVSIWATITGTTPATLAALLAPTPH
jgi:hypothetical protein